MQQEADEEHKRAKARAAKQRECQQNAKERYRQHVAKMKAKVKARVQQLESEGKLGMRKNFCRKSCNSN